MLSNLGRHKIIIITGVILFVGIAWYVLSSSSSPAPLVSTTQTGSTDDQGLSASLQALQGINLDVSIFTNPVFLSLQDFSTAIVPEPIGRSDPFAPLPASSAPTPGSTQIAQIFKSK